MGEEMLTGCRDDGTEQRFVLQVFQEGQHWTSTLARVSVDGEVEEGQAAPRFYGTSADQARRRMISALENEYNEVR